MADDSTTVPRRRQLRERTRKLYTDDWTLGDEDIEGRRSFQLDEKIECERYNLENFAGLFREMSGAELSLSYLQKHGLAIPLLFRDKAGLGLRVPSSNFSVNDVRTCVGSKRILDVMDVNTQKNEDMSMKDWQRYYEDFNKDRLLNVISLEFSHTKLENYVQSPAVVRQVDWVDVVWPRHLKEAQVEATNLLEDMMYPKVQKYCLMSVKGCYTDFHVDFGGTSVWYHILRGGKIFWLIPPTEKNLALYQEWVLSGKQSDVFFGDMVDRCGRISLVAGMTLFIPTGWIHAVYTPQDSLVFGGNFLHSFGIEKQLKVAQVEEHTKVPQKFRYPFFTEMLWYVLERYVHVLLGRSHLDIPENQRQHTITDTKIRGHLHLTPFELHGLKSIVMYLHSLPSTKKNVPELIRDPVALIHDVRCLVEQHRHDNPEAAVTGTPVLPPPPPLTIAERERMRTTTKKNYTKIQAIGNTSEKVEGGKSSFPRRRRTRCKKCEACTRTDCSECAYCQDMVKFGGTGRAKQTCLMRQCLRPMLPVTAACKVCRLDGWGQQPASLMGKPTPVTPSSLMECSVCFDIAHPECVGVDSQSIAVSEDVPNSWECPECCETGRNLDSRSRQGKSRARKVSVSSAASSAPTTDSERATTPSKRPRPDPNETWNEREPAEGEHRTALRSQLAVQLIGSSSKALKRPHVVVRPAQLPLQRAENVVQTLANDKSTIIAIFGYLNRLDLARCALVCRSWSQYSIEPSLWRRLDMSHVHLTASHLTGIARRQPENLCLDWSDVTKRQLAWLLGRLTQLRSLSLQGCAWSNVSVLRSCICPPLINLDLSHVSGLNDFSLREMLSPPSDSRPGLIDKTSRLKYLRTLSLAGCDVTDVALRYVAQHLPHVESLDLSSCGRLTDAGVAQLTTSPAHAINNLVSLNLASCRLLTETSLDHLARCKALKRLDLRHTTQVSTQSVIKFAARSMHNLHVTDVKLVQEKRPKNEIRVT